MKLPSLLLALAFIMAVSSTVVLAGENHDESLVFRWASTGVGWRAMFATMGFANIFQQAGLMDDDHSHLSAISSTSGASWFATQAFYSWPFYQRTVMAESPTALQAFASEWMTASLGLAQTKDIHDHEICDTTELRGVNSTNGTSEFEPSPLLLDTFEELCNMLMAYNNGDWAAYVEAVMTAAAVAYQDDQYPSRIASARNRVRPLRGTDLIVQSALMANSRIRNETATEDDTLVNLGPASNNELLYDVPLSAAYTVNSTFTGFQYNTDDNNNLQTYTEPISPDHNFREFPEYPLYPPADDASVEYSVVDEDDTDIMMTLSGSLRAPFGGQDTTTAIQIAAISSALLGPFSPAGPSTFTQFLSKYRAAFENDVLLERAIFDVAVKELYASPLLDNFAVCSQWPSPCQTTDGLMMDGGLVDTAAIPINIAQYQHSVDAESSLDKTLKIVVTSSDPVNTKLLQYFDTSMNRDVAPGDFIWFESSPLPFRSPQVFEDSLEAESLYALVDPIEGSTMTTAVIANLTTIDNPAFGIEAGQNVELLLINLNDVDIPAFFVGAMEIEAMTGPIAEMVRDIAASQELLQRVLDFFGFPTVATSTEKETTAVDDDGTGSDGGDGSESSEPPSASGPASIWILHLPGAFVWLASLLAPMIQLV